VNGIILNDMSDHLPILAFLSSELVPHKKEAKSYRDYNEQNLIKFRTSLSLVDWTSVIVGQDPNKLFDSFSAEYNKHFEDCFPLKISKHSPESRKRPGLLKVYWFPLEKRINSTRIPG
jgi:hypothetical protein